MPEGPRGGRRPTLGGPLTRGARSASTQGRGATRYDGGSQVDGWIVPGAIGVREARIAQMACDEKAVLLVTRQLEGTATTVAKQRIELRCSLEPDHAGAHRDVGHDQEWLVVKGRPSLAIRDESE